MKNFFVALIVIVVLAAGGWYVYRTMFAQNNNQEIIVVASPSASTSPETSAASPSPSVKPSPSQATVTYTDAGFSPKTLTVKKGTTVVFMNNSSRDIRVASNPHPIHNGYPTTGGCVASTFDSCSLIALGASWSFTFDSVGSWGYHDHLNPSQGGTVVVQ